MSSIAVTSPSHAERGVAGQTIVITGTSTTWNGQPNPITVNAGTITHQAVSSNTVVTLTYTAPSTAQTVTFTDSYDASHGTATLPITDTVAPVAPAAAPTRGAITRTFAFTLSWLAVAPSPAGETLTYRVWKNGVELTSAPGQSGTTLAVTGVVNGDLFKVKAEDNANNLSSAYSATFTFHAPDGFGADIGTDPAVPTITPALNDGNFSTFTGTVSVTLASSDGSSVIYTLNGDEPRTGENSTHIYTGAITLSVSTPLKAVAVSGGRRSATALQTFLKI